MIQDKNGCCAYVDLVCYQCSGSNYTDMDREPKGQMEYIKEDYNMSRRTHIYFCKDCGYKASYSTQYVEKHVHEIR